MISELQSGLICIPLSRRSVNHDLKQLPENKRFFFYQEIYRKGMARFLQKVNVYIVIIQECGIENVNKKHKRKKEQTLDAS